MLHDTAAPLPSIYPVSNRKMLPAINTSSSALLELGELETILSSLGEMQSKAREEVTSPTTIIRRRRPKENDTKVWALYYTDKFDHSLLQRDEEID
eukprot:1393192-Amorphochlora_amoeboformis.AAC.2